MSLLTETIRPTRGLQRYFIMMKERIARDARYVEETKMYSDNSTADARAEAMSALKGEREALNTRKRRSTWRDVKFRTRQGNKVFDIDNKTMDSELDKASFFLSKGDHRKTALEK